MLPGLGSEQDFISFVRCIVSARTLLNSKSLVNVTCLGILGAAIRCGIAVTVVRTVTAFDVYKPCNL